MREKELCERREPKVLLHEKTEKKGMERPTKNQKEMGREFRRV